MAKRLRTLASLLWDDGDPDTLHAQWTARVAGTMYPADKRRKSSPEDPPDNVLEDAKPEAVPVLQGVTVVKPWLQKKRQEDPWYWLKGLPEPVSGLQRLHSEIIPDLQRTSFADGCIVLDLPDSNVGSAVLRHGELAARSLSSRHPALHKIGITANPLRRWEHSEYGYKFDKHVKWQRMRIIHVHADAHAVGLLEAGLIRIFFGTSGCRNIRMGGEGIESQTAGPFFCYIVQCVLLPPKAS